jgi:hypothetical protein
MLDTDRVAGLGFKGVGSVESVKSVVCHCGPPGPTKARKLPLANISRGEEARNGEPLTSPIPPIREQGRSGWLLPQKAALFEAPCFQSVMAPNSAMADKESAFFHSICGYYLRFRAIVP